MKHIDANNNSLVTRLVRQNGRKNFLWADWRKNLLWRTLRLSRSQPHDVGSSSVRSGRLLALRHRRDYAAYEISRFQTLLLIASIARLTPASAATLTRPPHRA